MQHAAIGQMFHPSWWSDCLQDGLFGELGPAKRMQALDMVKVCNWRHTMYLVLVLAREAADGAGMWLQERSGVKTWKREFVPCS
jgi:hypothetical protein